MYIALGIVFFFVILFILYLFDMFSNENDAKKEYSLSSMDKFLP